MSSEIRKMKINAQNAMPQMILSDDVVLMNGSILVSQGTVLDEYVIQRIHDQNVSYINIYVQKIKNESGVYEDEALFERSLNIRERQEFQEFEKSYVDNSEEVRKSILYISDGGVVDLEQLYALTNGIMGKLSIQNDIFMYLHALRIKDDHTFTHSLNVSLLCNLFGHWANMPVEKIMELTVAGLLHDIGKTKIADEILNKPGKLTEEEFQNIKNHPLLGYHIIENQNISEEIKDGVLSHHEKIDGSGYPRGLKGNEIGDYAKIISICDIYDAMTANRIYRSKICPFHVIKAFEQKSYGELDTEYLLLFLKNIAYTYLHSKVILSNHQEGEVVFINGQSLADPIVKTGDDFLNLMEHKEVQILQLI